EAIRVRADLDRNIRAQFQRLLQPTLADEAPRAHHVGNDVNRERSSHGTPSGKRDQQKWKPVLRPVARLNRQPRTYALRYSPATMRRSIVRATSDSMVSRARNAA